MVSACAMGSMRDCVVSGRRRSVHIDERRPDVVHRSPSRIAKLNRKEIVTGRCVADVDERPPIRGYRRLRAGASALKAIHHLPAGYIHCKDTEWLVLYCGKTLRGFHRHPARR